MKSRNTLFSLLLVLAVFLAACGGAAAPDEMVEKPEDTMMEEKSDEPMAESTHNAVADDAMPESDEMTDEMNDETADMMESPAWFGAALTDARSGQTFSMDDFKGKVVLVETMAMWCSNCLKQQTQVKALHEALGMREDFVSIGLDIDPNENVNALKGYVEDKGFDWYYAVSPVDVSREIASLYGDQFLNPPSTPVLVIDRHGQAHVLPFGIKSADDLQQAIQPFLDESM
jgi:thiol-disulfide isomerase/thioredoxin